MSDIKIFTNSDFEPFAVFRFGSEPFDITRASAAEQYRHEFDPGVDTEEIASSAQGPGVFYLRRDGGEEDDESYPWHFCDPEDDGSVVCYGVTWR